VVTVQGAALSDVWQRGANAARDLVKRHKIDIRWLRIDHVDAIEEITWAELRQRLKTTKRNYFRFGISLDAAFRQAFLETEVNGNAMLYQGGDMVECAVNNTNFLRYAKRRHGLDAVEMGDDKPVWLFSSRGLLAGDGAKVHRLQGPGLDMGPRTSLVKMAPADEAGRRVVGQLTLGDVQRLIESGSRYLAGEVQSDGKFHYGWFPCFDRSINTYNALRHASSLYAMIEGWDVIRDDAVKAAIERSLGYLTQTLIKRAPLPSGETGAFLVDTGDEVKLGGNAVSILALVKYTDLTGDRRYLPLMDELAASILHMQNPETGGFAHVLHYPSLEVKDAFRTIYYDGEAAFGLMRLYELTRNPRWLGAVERAFEYFIAKQHWKAHDHWLSYCVNEMTRHRPERAYFEFGIQNFKDHLNFVIERITTYPTLLELMMAAEQMVSRLQNDPENAALLEQRQVDVEKFYYALEKRAHYMLNGHFWPELAMFYARPTSIVGGFFIRHHAFRVRIDDVEHYLSGYVAYRKYLLRKEAQPETAQKVQFETTQAAAVQVSSHDTVVEAKIQAGFAGKVAVLTGGQWLVPPAGDDWTMTGVCAAPLEFKEGQMLLAKGHNAGLPPAVVERLCARSAGIIAEAAVAKDYAGWGVPVLAVAGLRESIMALATDARSQFKGTMIGVTGSVGKTTTTAMMAHALAGVGTVDRSKTAANSLYGISWNVASMDRGADFWVQEMAANRMESCTRLVRPHVAIVTTIAPAHLADFGSTEKVARLKARICLGMPPGGIMVVNADMNEFGIFESQARAVNLRVVRFGAGEGNDARLLGIEGATVHAEIMGKTCSFILGVPGRHMAMNALAVLAAVAALGQPLEAAAARLASFEALAGRGKRSRLVYKGKAIEVWDEAYNANPGSMRAALQVMCDAGEDIPRQSRVLVLGDMLELGAGEQEMHLALEPDIRALEPDRVLFCGPLMQPLAQRLLPDFKGCAWPDVQAMIPQLANWLKNDDVVLVKSSHGTGLGKVVAHLAKNA
ncbi:MAG: glutamate ligase, partial [Burkholderiaceae bacterium]|nr:glutamate ligase [Burkholderiaceae bacterium]